MKTLIFSSSSPAHNSRLLVHIGWLCLLLCHVACREKSPQDTPTSGQLVVYCDESILPPFEEARRVFESEYPKAKIRFTTMPAGLAIAHLLNGSVQYVIAARGLDSNELSFVSKTRTDVSQQKVALDGLGILVHRSNPISEMDMQALADVFSGRVTTWHHVADSLPFPRGTDRIDVVFDGVQSSNYQFMASDVLGGQPNSVKAKWLEGDSTRGAPLSIMDYVASHPASIGYISTAWLGENPEYIRSADRLKVVRLAGVDYHKAVDPIPGYVYRGDYPLRRIIYVIDGTKGSGLGAGFTAFLTGNEGQKLLLNSNLVPAINPIRLVHE